MIPSVMSDYIEKRYYSSYFDRLRAVLGTRLFLDRVRLLWDSLSSQWNGQPVMSTLFDQQTGKNYDFSLLVTRPPLEMKDQPRKYAAALKEKLQVQFIPRGSDKSLFSFEAFKLFREFIEPLLSEKNEKKLSQNIDSILNKTFDFQGLLTDLIHDAAENGWLDFEKGGFIASPASNQGSGSPSLTSGTHPGAPRSEVRETPVTETSADKAAHKQVVRFEKDLKGPRKAPFYFYGILYLGLFVSLFVLSSFSNDIAVELFGGLAIAGVLFFVADRADPFLKGRWRERILTYGNDPRLISALPALREWLKEIPEEIIATSGYERSPNGVKVYRNTYKPNPKWIEVNKLIKTLEQIEALKGKAATKDQTSRLEARVMNEMNLGRLKEILAANSFNVVYAMPRADGVSQKNPWSSVFRKSQNWFRSLFYRGDWYDPSFFGSQERKLFENEAEPSASFVLLSNIASVPDRPYRVERFLPERWRDGWIPTERLNVALKVAGANGETGTRVALIRFYLTRNEFDEVRKMLAARPGLILDALTGLKQSFGDFPAEQFLKPFTEPQRDPMILSLWSRSLDRFSRSEVRSAEEQLERIRQDLARWMDPEYLKANANIMHQRGLSVEPDGTVLPVGESASVLSSDQLADEAVRVLTDHKLLFPRDERMGPQFLDKTFWKNYYTYLTLTQLPEIDFSEASRKIEEVLNAISPDNEHDANYDIADALAEQLWAYVASKPDSVLLNKFVDEVLAFTFRLYNRRYAIPGYRVDAFHSVYEFVHALDNGIIGSSERDGQIFIEYLGYEGRISWEENKGTLIPKIIASVRKKAVRSEVRSMKDFGVTVAGVDGQDEYLRVKFDTESRKVGFSLRWPDEVTRARYPYVLVYAGAFGSEGPQGIAAQETGKDGLLSRYEAVIPSYLNARDFTLYMTEEALTSRSRPEPVWLGHNFSLVTPEQLKSEPAFKGFSFQVYKKGSTYRFIVNKDATPAKRFQLLGYARYRMPGDSVWQNKAAELITTDTSTEKLVFEVKFDEKNPLPEALTFAYTYRGRFMTPTDHEDFFQHKLEGYELQEDRGNVSMRDLGVGFSVENEKFQRVVLDSDRTMTFRLQWPNAAIKAIYEKQVFVQYGEFGITGSGSVEPKILREDGLSTVYQATVGQERYHYGLRDFTVFMNGDFRDFGISQPEAVWLGTNYSAVTEDQIKTEPAFGGFDEHLQLQDDGSYLFKVRVKADPSVRPAPVSIYVYYGDVMREAEYVNWPKSENEHVYKIKFGRNVPDKVRLGYTWFGPAFPKPGAHHFSEDRWAEVPAIPAEHMTGEISVRRSEARKDLGTARSEMRKISEAKFTTVDVPQNFLGALELYSLTPAKIEVLSLDKKSVKKGLLNDPLVSFALSSSISQAFGGQIFTGRGKDVKKIADANAVQFTESSIIHFTEKNPRIAVVILADEGAKDES